MGRCPGCGRYVLFGFNDKQAIADHRAGKLSEADEAHRKATQVLEKLQAELADKPDLLAEFQRYQAQLLKTEK